MSFESSKIEIERAPNGKVIDLETRAIQLLDGRRFEFRKIASASLQLLTDRLQRCIQRRCDRAFFIRQIAVARTEREPVIVPHRLTGNNSDRQAQIVGHATNHKLLLVVLLAEHRNIRPYDREQARDDSGDAVKVSRTRRTAEVLG